MKESIRQQLLEHYARDIEGLNGEELIAEALASIEAMFSYMDEDDVFKRSRPYAVSYLALCAAQELISKNVSAGEYQPVKQGRWEINCDGYYLYCSNCKNEPQGREMTLYCPNCGARMDGDTE